VKNTEFDLPAFLLGKLYDPEEIASGWTLADAINLAEDIRKYDGEDCDPQEIYEIMLEFARQDAEDEQL
jgi:hypothetical protein